MDELLSGKHVKRPRFDFNNSMTTHTAMCIRACMEAEDERRNLKQLKSEMANVLKIK